MVCILAAPAWSDPLQTGIQSAIENVADNTVVLTWHTAQATLPATQLYYLVYHSSDANNLFDHPKYISLATQFAIPQTLADPEDYFAVRPAQLGVTDIFNDTNLVEVFTDGYTFAAPVELSVPLAPADGYIYVNSTDGFPNSDGYLLIGTEIIHYASVTTTGPTGFFIQSRNPYGCNDAYVASYPIETEVSLYKGSESIAGSRIKGLHSCGLLRPTWVNTRAPGVQAVKDLGIGTAVEVTWGPAQAPTGFSNLYYNVYADSNMYTLGFNPPVGITDQLQVVVTDLHPGDGYHFAVQATYLFDTLDTSTMNMLGENFFAYPEPALISEIDGYYHTTDLTPLRVNSTDGFPPSGLLRIASEILEYEGITANTFLVTRRDVFSFENTTDYPNNTTIQLFKGIEDGNRSAYMSTPTWTAKQAWLPPTPGDGADGYLYLQDSDGYRAIPVNNITEDHEEFEDNNIDFSSLDYCGYHSQNFVNLYTRNMCGSYIGGRIGGFSGGIDVFTANTQRQEMLLGLTGEPFVLLKRKWTGRICPRFSLRDEHPYARCCYGTTFEGGYDRYRNPRGLRPTEPNPNGFISMRVKPYTDDLALVDSRGLTVEIVEIDVWTIAIPLIKDRDILIRYVYDSEMGVIREEFRYEVLSVLRNKLLLGADGAQQIRMKRLNRTDEIYKFKVGLV